MLCLAAILIISIGTSIIRGIFEFIVDFFRYPRHADDYTDQSHPSDQQSQPHQSAPTGGKKREKVFDKTDGEYVDFEEIKQ